REQGPEGEIGPLAEGGHGAEARGERGHLAAGGQDARAHPLVDVDVGPPGAPASKRMTSAWRGSVSWNSSTKSQRYLSWRAARTVGSSRSRAAAYWSRSL